MLDFHGTEYLGHSNFGTPHSDERMADELMIANMLNLLNNPMLAKMLDANELNTVLQTVKNHVVAKAERVLTHQNQYMKEQEYGSIGRQFR